MFTNSMNSDIKSPVLGVGTVVIRHNTVLLIKCNQGPKKGIWSIPIGPHRMGETLQQAVERETLAMTGMKVKGGRPVYNHDLIERGEDGGVLQHYLIIYLAAEYLSGNPVPGAEAEDVAWVSVEAMEFMDIDEEALLLLEALEFLELADDE